MFPIVQPALPQQPDQGILRPRNDEDRTLDGSGIDRRQEARMIPLAAAALLHCTQSNGRRGASLRAAFLLNVSAQPPQRKILN